MPTPILRQSLGFDEIFDVKPVSQEEVQLPRTENLDNMLNPNWESPLEQFELGKYNSLTQTSIFSLSRFISMMERQQELLLSILEKIANLLIELKK